MLISTQTMRSILLILLIQYVLCGTCSSGPIEGAEDIHDLPDDPHWSSIAHEDVDCTCERSSSAQSCFNPQNGTSCGARIFYLIVVHNNRTMNDALYLFRGIRDSRNTILIHIDVKFGMKPYESSVLKQEIDACPCGSHVEVASVHNSSWSSWSMNAPTLWGVEKAVNEYEGKWDVFINLSGDTLPVYTPDRVANLLIGPLAKTNFVTSHSCETGLVPTPIDFFPKKWHKRGHYSQQPASLNYIDDEGVSHSNYAPKTYFGSQWMVLQFDWCQLLVRQLNRADSLASQYKNYLIATGKLMTDETFIPTMLMHYMPKTIPEVDEDGYLDVDEVDMYAIRYERMDENMPNSQGVYTTIQRYGVPEKSGVDAPHAWGPYFLGVYDLENIRQSGALFIRKVSSVIDPNLFRLLPVDKPEDIPLIGWPKEVKIDPVIDWKDKIEAFKKKYIHDHPEILLEKEAHESSSSSSDYDGAKTEI